jgi:cell division protein FtsZ
MERAPSILLLGLGGAGCSMVARLSAALPAEVGALFLDTDERSLPADARTIQLGRQQTRGMGTGGETGAGLAAAESEEVALRRALAGAPVVVIVTGLGGGTGSGAGPFVAGLAADSGATVLCFATMPFSHEGERRQREADQAATALAARCHGFVAVHNDLLLQLVPADPAAIRSILSTPGSPTLCAFGAGEGPRAAMTAARAAVECPLAHGPGAVTKVASIFVHVSGGPELTSTDAFDAVAMVRQKFGGNTATVLCARTDPGMAGRAEVSVLGASLPEPKPAKARKGGKGAKDDQSQTVFPFATDDAVRRGFFGGAPLTIVDGQDIDVPTYIRRAVRLPAGP